MSDRPNVHLTVLTVHRDAVLKIAEAAGYTACSDEATITSTIPCITFFYEEVRNGDLPFLPKLINAGIAYTAWWTAFESVVSGEESCRFTEDGDIELKEIIDLERGTISLTEVEEHLDNPEALQKLVKDRRNHLTVLPWDNQEEYGLKFVALQLIRPKNI